MSNITLNELRKLTISLHSNQRAWDKVSHFKVNSFVYDILRNSNQPDITYHEAINALLLLEKPVFVNDDLDIEQIVMYEYKENPPPRTTSDFTPEFRNSAYQSRVNKTLIPPFCGKIKPIKIDLI